MEDTKSQAISDQCVAAIERALDQTLGEELIQTRAKLKSVETKYAKLCRRYADHLRRCGATDDTK
jgi:hypothetical protein